MYLPHGVYQSSIYMPASLYHVPLGGNTRKKLIKCCRSEQVELGIDVEALSH
jgi:hypothetical protein